MNFELGILNAMQKHIHAGKVVGGNIFFLPVYFSDGAAGFYHSFADVKQQRTRTTGKIQYAFNLFLFAFARVLAVERYNGRKNIGYSLWCVKFSCLFA